MKIIDLLNKIANGDIPKKIKYKDLEYRACGNGISGFTDYVNDDDRYCFSAYIGVKTLNDEVEILEEEKKIPEKIKIDNEDRIQALSTGNFAYKVNQPTKNIIYKINEIIDFLKSKGDE